MVLILVVDVDSSGPKTYKSLGAYQLVIAVMFLNKCLRLSPMFNSKARIKYDLVPQKCGHAK